ncbi:uncharacterized protein LOC130806215 [Amaranthus tricolor]|uniref:uncharacterized protein LOC130806215 n=1 Tax=Amaranthus tricolor TaxID=29722 RepID=UPI00258B0836|nr:uncharacterized protein LOC130806215 [Amaranthus tricolor]
MQMQRIFHNLCTMLILVLLFLNKPGSVIGKMPKGGPPGWEVEFGITLKIELEIDMHSQNYNEISESVEELVSSAGRKSEIVHQPDITALFNAPILGKLPKGLSPKLTLGIELTLGKELELELQSSNISAIVKELKELVNSARKTQNQEIFF